MKQKDMIKDSPELEGITKDDIYKELYHNSPIMHRIINRNGVIILANKTYAKKLGYAFDEIIGASIFDHIAPKSIGDMKKSYDQWIATGQVYDIHVWLKRKDGSEFPVLLSANNLYGKDGRLIGSNTAIVDTSELAKAQQLIENLQLKRLTDIGELAARIAHDMRNPLSIIKATLEVLQTKNDPVMKRFDDHFQRINRSVMRISHQVEEVLDYVKPKPLQIQSHSILAILKNVVERLKHDAVTINLPENDSIIECDDEKLEIVFTNLILNAIQVMNNKGTVTIRIYEQQDTVGIDIEDTGPGIPPELRPKIFEPLFTTRQIGTGLGLPSCKVIVEKHHGMISFVSTVGRGTTFTIMLPKLQPKTAL
jgi:PAS domain S-box-containing protein